MRGRVRAMWQLLGGGFPGRIGKWVRCLNLVALMLSVGVAYIGVTSFTHWYLPEWQSGPREISQVSVMGGWARFSVSERREYASWESHRWPEWSQADYDRVLATIGWRRLLARHLDWPLRISSGDAQPLWEYSLIHGVLHLWSLPLICFIRAVIRKRRGRT